MQLRFLRLLLTSHFSLLTAAALAGGLLFAGCATYSGKGGRQGPPAGFTALFNGKDLAGWWGEKTTDPRSYLSLPPEQLAAVSPG
jgi:hypothetical protein